MKEIIKEVAKKNSISEKEVREEIKKAISAAMQNEDPGAQAFWNRIAKKGEEPTAEEVIAALAAEVYNSIDWLRDE